MLSRVANNIYWLGRYLERAEYLARYTSVQYFSIYDAPSLQNFEFVMRSIVNMTGIDYDLSTQELDEQEILFKIGLERNSNVSIFSAVSAVRENARSSRNILSDELWERINQFYLYVQEYDQEYFKTQGLFEFTQELNRHCNLIKSYLNHTMLHEFSWRLICIGFYTERIVQILRAIKNKLIDISILNHEQRHKVLEDYQWTLALKIVEAFDIYRRTIRPYNKNYSPVEFMLFHDTFPRSVVYSLKKVSQLIDGIPGQTNNLDRLRFQAGKLYHTVRYTSREEIEDLTEFTDDLLLKMNGLHEAVDNLILGAQDDWDEDIQETVNDAQ